MSRKPTTRRKPRAPDVEGRPAGRRGETAAAPDPRRDAVTRPTLDAEDFAARHDIETADEPLEQHDRRYHDGGGLA
jgi:hypothetical protein